MSNVKNNHRRRRMSRVRIGGIGSRRNITPRRMQQRTVVPWKWWWLRKFS